MLWCAQPAHCTFFIVQYATLSLNFNNYWWFDFFSPVISSFLFMFLCVYVWTYVLLWLFILSFCLFVLSLHRGSTQSLCDESVHSHINCTYAQIKRLQVISIFNMIRKNQFKLVRIYRWVLRVFILFRFILSLK